MITGNEPAMPRMAQNLGQGMDYYEIPGSPGLTIRQHFAAMAMQGLLSNSGLETTIPEHYAMRAVKCADALITELNKKQ